jgi:hypothetical protein
MTGPLNKKVYIIVVFMLTLLIVVLWTSTCPCSDSVEWLIVKENSSFLCKLKSKIIS